MLWQTLHHTFDLSRRGVVMGILNVTPDSFSDGGSWTDLEAAVSHAKRMIEEGAEIIDVGGESTRPGAQPVSEEEEMRRVLPVIERLRAVPTPFPTVISIDTMKPEVARAAVAAGAGIINDVSGLRNAGMLEVLRETGAGTIIMHMQGEPQTMQQSPSYEDVVGEIREFFRQTTMRCLASGVPQTRTILDPGIGFGKNLPHNLTLLRHLAELSAGARPLMIGAGRKSFIGKILGSSSLEDRSWPTVALTSFARRAGARVFRVHEVKANVEALRMTEAIAA
jgi:dihydropteroate synthase